MLLVSRVWEDLPLHVAVVGNVLDWRNSIGIPSDVHHAWCLAAILAQAVGTKGYLGSICVVMATYGATSDDKLGILMDVSFQEYIDMTSVDERGGGFLFSV